MKLFRTFALALGIALPLWWRQRAFERKTNEDLYRYSETVDDAFQERDRELSEGIKMLVRRDDEVLREVNRAFRKAGRG